MVLRSQILNHKINLKLTSKPNIHVNHTRGDADIHFLYPKLDIKLNLQLNSRVKGTGVEAPADMLFLTRPLSSLALPVVEEVRLFSFFEIRFLGDWAGVYRKHVCVREREIERARARAIERSSERAREMEGGREMLYSV